MVGDGEGACEDGAGFAVFFLAVAEEEAVGGGVGVAHGAALAYVDAGEHGAVGDARAVLYDEVVEHDSAADVDGARLAAHEGAVAEA